MSHCLLYLSFPCLVFTISSFDIGVRYVMNFLGVPYSTEKCHAASGYFSLWTHNHHVADSIDPFSLSHTHTYTSAKEKSIQPLYCKMSTLALSQWVTWNAKDFLRSFMPREAEDGKSRVSSEDVARVVTRFGSLTSMATLVIICRRLLAAEIKKNDSVWDSLRTVWLTVTVTSLLPVKIFPTLLDSKSK